MTGCPLFTRQVLVTYFLKLEQMTLDPLDKMALQIAGTDPIVIMEVSVRHEGYGAARGCSIFLYSV